MSNVKMEKVFEIKSNGIRYIAIHEEDDHEYLIVIGEKYGNYECQIEAYDENGQLSYEIDKSTSNRNIYTCSTSGGVLCYDTWYGHSVRRYIVTSLHDNGKLLNVGNKSDDWYRGGDGLLYGDGNENVHVISDNKFDLVGKKSIVGRMFPENTIEIIKYKSSGIGNVWAICNDKDQIIAYVVQTSQGSHVLLDPQLYNAITLCKSQLLIDVMNRHGINSMTEITRGDETHIVILCDYLYNGIIEIYYHNDIVDVVNQFRIDDCDQMFVFGSRFYCIDKKNNSAVAFDIKFHQYCPNVAVFGSAMRRRTKFAEVMFEF